MKKKHAILAFKIALIITAFSIVFAKIDTQKLTEYITTINPLAIVFTYFLLVLAQLISALRTRFYYSTAGLYLSRPFAAALYFVGIFFNILLPGGIGGDGYKIYIMDKLASFSKLTSLRLLLSDRASGLNALMMLCFIFTFFSDIPKQFPQIEVLLYMFILITFLTYLIAVKRILKEKPVTAYKAMWYSFWVQFSSIPITIILLWGFGHNVTNPTVVSNYIVLFFASSIMAVLPISIGGAGLREITFLYGTEIMGLDMELGIALAMVFFLINVLCAVNGAFLWHKLKKIYTKYEEGEVHGST